MIKVLKRMMHPVGIFSLVILIGYALVAILAPVLAQPRAGFSPYEIPRAGFSVQPRPPSSEHLLGSTQGQYDIYYGLVWGTRTAFKIAIVVVTVGFTLGLTIGGIAGYYGSLLEEILMRVTDIFLSFPFLLAAMVLATVLGKGLGSIMIALVAFRWMTYARLVRSEVVSVKENEYVEGARAQGSSDARILIKHVLPNSMFPALIQASMDVGRVVLTASALSFLGLGMEPGYADWGQLISMARNWILGGPKGTFQYWYVVFFPGVTLYVFVLAWNMLGDALRDTFDPKMRGSL